ncbi:hypothetical protein E3N88_17981 [Mikania micrantha]|uniref:Uncharacterized protein n=1 Tax=Mikania micrantha TaxID=192012 RepID=A0A5N6NVL7_9ASTR|nr:hypothetical protein E3N88_17981 [Mikania micrantha]
MANVYNLNNVRKSGKRSRSEDARVSPIAAHLFNRPDIGHSECDYEDEATFWTSKRLKRSHYSVLPNPDLLVIVLAVLAVFCEDELNY